MRNQIAVWNDENWSPFRVATGFDRLWDELTGHEAARVQAFTPACDVQDTESHYLLSLDVPGVSKENIQIEVKDNRLLISGERKEDHEAKEGSRVFVERTYGKFQRAFTLGRNVDASRIEAGYQDGVLKILVPKAEEAKPKSIEIKVGEKAGLFGKVFGKSEAKLN